MGAISLFGVAESLLRSPEHNCTVAGVLLPFSAVFSPSTIHPLQSGEPNCQPGSHPFHPGDTTLTRQTLEVLREHGLGFCTLSKGGQRSLGCIDLFRRETDAYAATLTSLNDAFSREWEPCGALPGDRIAALKAFHAQGIFTWVSLEPVLDVESSLAIVEATHGFVDLFKIGRINYSAFTRTIDWRSFTERMIELCSRLGVHHYVKKDLACYLSAGYPNPVRVQQHHGSRDSR